MRCQGQRSLAVLPMHCWRALLKVSKYRMALAHAAHWACMGAAGTIFVTDIN